MILLLTPHHSGFVVSPTSYGYSLTPRGMDCWAARSIAVVSALALLSVLIVLQFMPAVYWFVRMENFVQSAFLLFHLGRVLLSILGLETWI